MAKGKDTQGEVTRDSARREFLQGAGATALAAAAANAASTTYSWPRIAAHTLDVYRGLLGE